MNSLETTFKALAQDSVKLIEWNQHPSGGYTACPLFSHYAFSWLRDGSFIAYAMDLAGKHESAGSFYAWVNRILHNKIGHIEMLVGKHSRGEWIGQEQFLHTRYHLDGRDDEHSEWGHFQLDGYGAWLWGLTCHLKATGQSRIPEGFLASVNATVEYLRTFWRLPNFDCWEEHSDGIHPSTLACIYGGLKRIAEMESRQDLEEVCREIREFLLEHAVHPEEGRFVKYLNPSEGGHRIGNAGVDASLMWLCEPFGLFEPDHPVMKRTLDKIEGDLKTRDGGLRRYIGDTYYGGGEWLLLTAWYGWLKLAEGDRAPAEQALRWIASKADDKGRLPEQVPDALENKNTYDEWVQRWGTPAMPLLWSHAMYLVLYHKLYG